MTAPSKKTIPRAETRHRLFRKQTGRQTSCVLLAAVSAQRPDDQLAIEPPKRKKSSCLRSVPVPKPHSAHVQQLTQCSFSSSHLVQLARFSNTSWKPVCLQPHFVPVLEGDVQFLLKELLVCPILVPCLTAGQAAHPRERVRHCVSRVSTCKGTMSGFFPRPV